MIETRISQLRALMNQRGYDAVVLRDTADLRWLTGAAYVFDHERAHTAYITHDHLFLHTDSRYYNAFVVRLGDTSPWVIDMKHLSSAAWVIERALETGSRALAIEDSLTLKEFTQLTRAMQDRSLSFNFSQLHGCVQRLRSVKDADEIAVMRRAQSITDAAFTYVLGRIAPGRTELEVKSELDSFMLQNGADSLSFDTILVTGANAANPHGVSGKKTIAHGDFIVMDFGARVEDYCSDMTRTVHVGAPHEEHLLMYETVRAANERCSEKIKAGETGESVWNTAVDVLDSKGFAQYFQHGLGHGVGIEIHEMPVLGRGQTTPLEAGQVITNEPGVYIPGKGGVRIEDCGVVREDGFDIFTQSTRELQVL